jgi:hypothetical protein
MQNNWQKLSYSNHGLQMVPLLKAGGRRVRNSPGNILFRQVKCPERGGAAAFMLAPTTKLTPSDTESSELRTDGSALGLTRPFRMAGPI